MLWSLDYYYKSWQPRIQVWAVTGRTACAMVRRCSEPQHMEAPLLVNVVTLPKALCSRPIPMELCLWISMLPHKGITLITGKSYAIYLTIHLRIRLFALCINTFEIKCVKQMQIFVIFKNQFSSRIIFTANFHN